MRANINIIHRRAIISLQGRFNFGAHRVFEKSCETILQSAEISELEIDFNAVQYMDSSALGMLLLLKERTGHACKSLTLSNCHGAAKEIMEVADFIRLFKTI